VLQEISYQVCDFADVNHGVHVVVALDKREAPILACKAVYMAVDWG
jgi:hypothetical protein